jgi:phenylacetate-CoA ligase
MIILRGVNLFPTQIEELILRLPALSPHFQCQLSRPGRMDQMTVRVEHRVDVDPARAPEEGSKLAKLIKNQIGVTVTVDVVAPGGIERSVGKMRRIIDDRPKG